MSNSVECNGLSQFSRLLCLPLPARRRRITQLKATVNCYSAMAMRQLTLGTISTLVTCGSGPFNSSTLRFR